MKRLLAPTTTAAILLAFVGSAYGITIYLNGSYLGVTCGSSSGSSSIVASSSFCRFLEDQLSLSAASSSLANLPPPPPSSPPPTPPVPVLETVVSGVFDVDDVDMLPTVGNGGFDPATGRITDHVAYGDFRIPAGFDGPGVVSRNGQYGVVRDLGPGTFTYSARDCIDIRYSSMGGHQECFDIYIDVNVDLSPTERVYVFDTGSARGPNSQGRCPSGYLGLSSRNGAGSRCVIGARIPNGVVPPGNFDDSATCFAGGCVSGSSVIRSIAGVDDAVVIAAGAVVVITVSAYCLIYEIPGTGGSTPCETFGAAISELFTSVGDFVFRRRRATISEICRLIGPSQDSPGFCEYACPRTGIVEYPSPDGDYCPETIGRLESGTPVFGTEP